MKNPDETIEHYPVVCEGFPNQNNKNIIGAFPESIKSSMQYGDNPRAFVKTLNVSKMIAIKRIYDI